MIRIEEGRPWPLGAAWDGRGVNFALFSAHASAVDLCLFDSTGRRETRRIRMPARTDQVFHAYVAGLRPGQLYGYRVHGRYEPAAGHRFNPNKLLLDPYARLLSGRIRWHDALFGYRMGAHRGDLTMDRRDSAPMMPKCVVEDPAYTWGDDRPPRRPMRDSFIYEAHVKGLSQLHPDIPMAMRGTYDALAHPAIVEHLLKLGVTAVELLPIHAYSDDRFLVEKGLKNYWGYSTLGYFAPDPRYLSEDGVHGLKAAIATLHAAGIEVILDVVYNHTAEGNQFGPTLSWRGIDNASYYKLVPDNPRFYWDATGTGNTLDLGHPRVMQMVMDSLRHWVQAYRIDGFRFDLATTLARDSFDFWERAGFLRAVNQDPVLSRVKLIAEPWDLGDAGYRLGGFPPGWSEWNDRFRDVIRSYWRGDEGRLPELARVIMGSREIFEHEGRQPWTSIHFVCSHDGFTLEDLVSYNERHNEANGENGQDGHPHNLSWNCGVEGPTEDPGILALRARQKRNLLATVMMSIGTPMLLMGDELSRTQGGNNNPYCQDNETSWFDWQAGWTADPDLPAFVQALAGFRRRHRALRPDAFPSGAMNRETGLRDVHWLTPEGREMTRADWADPARKALGVQMGNSHPSERLLLLFNAGEEDVRFRLTPHLRGGRWVKVFGTELPDGGVRGAAPILEPGGVYELEARSFAIFLHSPSPDAQQGPGAVIPEEVQ